MGLVVLIGPKNTLVFFAKKNRIQGSACYFAGFLLIIIGWFLFTTIGFLLQMYGLFMLFGSFMPTMLNYAQTLPTIGPFVRNQPWLH